MFIISGNHDDAKRLGASKPLAEKHNIILATSLDGVDILFTKKDARNRVIDAGKGYIKVKCADEECVIAFLPYISQAKCKQMAGDANFEYGEAVSKLAIEGCSHFSADALNIFVSHLFVVGASLGERGEVRVGDACAVEQKYLPQNAHYIALGHLHRAQRIGENIFYPGATIELRVRDNPPSVFSIVGDKEGVKTVKTIPLKSANRIRAIRVNGVANAYRELSLSSQKELIMLTIASGEPLKASDIKELRRLFPNLISIDLDLKPVSKMGGANKSRKEMDDAELFVEFYKSQTGEIPPQGLVNMFLECRSNIDATD